MERYVRVGLICVVLGLALVGGTLAGTRPVEPHYELEYTDPPASEPAPSAVVSYGTLSEDVQFELGGRAPGAPFVYVLDDARSAEDTDRRLTPAEWDDSTLRSHEYVRGGHGILGYEARYDWLSTGNSPFPLPVGVPLGAATLVYGALVFRTRTVRGLVPKYAAAVAAGLVEGSVLAAVLWRLSTPGVPLGIVFGAVLQTVALGVAFVGGAALDRWGGPLAFTLVACMLALAGYSLFTPYVWLNVSFWASVLPVLGFLAGRFLSRNERTRESERRETPDWAEGPW